jgi:hypothetical protein
VCDRSCAHRRAEDVEKLEEFRHDQGCLDQGCVVVVVLILLAGHAEGIHPATVSAVLFAAPLRSDRALQRGQHAGTILLSLSVCCLALTDSLLSSRRPWRWRTGSERCFPPSNLPSALLGQPRALRCQTTPLHHSPSLKSVLCSNALSSSLVTHNHGQSGSIRTHSSGGPERRFRHPTRRTRTDGAHDRSVCACAWRCGDCAVCGQCAGSRSNHRPRAGLVWHRQLLSRPSPLPPPLFPIQNLYNSRRHHRQAPQPPPRWTAALLPTSS